MGGANCAACFSHSRSFFCYSAPVRLPPILKTCDSNCVQLRRFLPTIKARRFLEISYSASTKDKYQRSSNSALQGIEIHIVPIDGVLDLKVLRFEHGWGGSIMGVLSSEPTTQQIDLCGSYRFEKPGHYSVAITSNEVSRIKSAEEGGGLENLTLESNWVDIDILPRDPAWAAAELNSISLGTQQCRAWGGSSCRWPPGSFGHPSFRNECFCSFICSGPTQLDPNGC